MLPYEFTVQVDFRPDGRADLKMRCIDDSKRDIALASRRPSRGGDAADLAFAAVVGVKKRVMGRLVAGDIQADEPATRTLSALGQQRTPPREMPFVEIHQPPEAELERRAVAPGANRVFGRYEIDIGQKEPCLDARSVQGLRADRADAARAPRLHKASHTASAASRSIHSA